MELDEGREGSSSASPRDTVYVAVGSTVKKNQKNLEWALQEFGDADFVILHIHSPSPTMPSPMGGKMPCSSASEQKVKEFRKDERKKMEEAIQQYTAICAAHKVNVDKLVVESTDIQGRIVELVAQLNIKILVMGAAADSNFNKIPISSNVSCASRKMLDPASRKAQYVNANALPSCRIRFVCKGIHIYTRQASTSHNPSRIAPERIQSEKINPISTNGKRVVKPFFSFPAHRRQDAAAVPQLRRDGSSGSSIFSTDNSGASEGLAPTEENDDDDYIVYSGVNGELDRVSEETTMAQPLAKISELHRRNDELEKENTSLRARLEKMQMESNQATFLSTENFALCEKVRELTDINRSLQKQNDEAIQAQKQLQSLTDIDKGIPSIPNFLHFNFAELEEATNGFAEEMRIGRGGFGTVYKGKLHHTMVAIKKLNPNPEKEKMDADAEFYQEIQALTRVRHPNLVALIGACPEERCLIYEYVQHGNLGDHLFDCNGKSPLLRKDRLKIAAEICLALLFLHSTKPQPIVHGDLKPTNILLDATNKAKIADFGICRFLPEVQRKSVETIVKLTNAKGTLGYMDPEFMATNELTFKSDVYAFGMILLQLLTGKSEFGLVRTVKTALNNAALHSVLDHSAGTWSDDEAIELCNLGLHCCETSRKSRPDLKTQVWEKLELYLQ